LLGESASSACLARLGSVQPSTGSPILKGALNTRSGFLPIATPITKPAVGLGLALGLTYFHEKPQVVHDASGESRVIMPTLTAVFGAGSENGTWAAGLAHIGVSEDGRTRYQGVAGCAALDLDWDGQGDSLNGNSIAYGNDLWFVRQEVTFQLADTDFHLGPFWRFLSNDASLDADLVGVPLPDLESQTSGLGLVLNLGSRDQPFSPTRGVRAAVSYAQQADWLGGDFDYGTLAAYGIYYQPLGDGWVLGLRVDGQFQDGDVPFYDLSSPYLRGIPRGRFVDDDSILAEAELCWDFVRRWTLVGFGGVARVAPDADDLLDAEDELAGGAGFRYLIAEQYGLRMGLDAAYGDDDWTVYVTVGTGWARP
jgi:hypothetical protein